MYSVRQQASEISQLERAAEDADPFDDEEVLEAAADVQRAQQTQLHLTRADDE